MNGIFAGIIVFALSVLALRMLRGPQVDEDGWYRLTASWLLHLFLVLGGILLGLFVWMWFNFNEARPDALEQRFWLGLLIIASTGAVAWLLGTIYARTIAWSDNQLRVRRWFGDEQVRDLSEVSSIVRNDVTGSYTISFADGSRLSFPVYMHGADDLAAKLARADT